MLLQRFLLSWMASLSMMAFTLPCVADTVNERLEVLESEVVSLRAQLRRLPPTETGAPVWHGGSVRAEGILASTTTGSDEGFRYDTGHDCCDRGGSWLVDYEALFLRFNRAEGVQSRDALPMANNFAFTPRLTLGYVTANGLGLRGRWFDFRNTSRNASGTLAVGTHNVDLEVFERIQLTCNTSIEWSGGVRYNDYVEEMRSFVRLLDQSTGWGGVVGLELNRDIRWGTFFGRTRGALLANDKFKSQPLQVGPIPDATGGMIELTLGWEMQHCLRNGMNATLGLGYEWQNWFNFSTDHLHGAAYDPVDTGFDGFLVSVGLDY